MQTQQMQLSQLAAGMEQIVNSCSRLEDEFLEKTVWLDESEEGKG